MYKNILSNPSIIPNSNPLSPIILLHQSIVIIMFISTILAKKHEKKTKRKKLVSWKVVTIRREKLSNI